MQAQSDKRRQTAGDVEKTFREYDRELHGFLLRRLRGRRELSEDLRQEIYLRLLRFSNTELVREPRAYLFRVARNVLYDKALLAERERDTFDDSHNSTPDGVAEDRSDQGDLERILSKLPPLYRAVLCLRTSHGLSYGEIARQLQLAESTVRTYMHLALVKARTISLEGGMSCSRREHD